MGNFNKGVYIFDADGTLTNTGPAHIIFCNDLNVEQGFNLPIINPKNPVKVREILGTPMRKLLENYGFPKESLESLDEIYKEKFSADTKYKSNSFPGISGLLKKLSKTKRYMVLLTSNTSKNVKRDLGDEIWSIFDQHIDREELKGYYKESKEEAIKFLNIAEFDRIPADALVCVGDTEKDYIAARNAGCRFIGVSYGWELKNNDQRFPVAQSVKELERYLLSAFKT